MSDGYGWLKNGPRESVADAGDPLDAVVALVRAEVVRARGKFAPFNSPHEGWAVIREELDELWEECRANRGRQASARTEAIQTAAMAIRYILDLALIEAEV